MRLLQATDQMTGQCKIIRALPCAKLQTLKNALLNVNREKHAARRNESAIFIMFSPH